MTDDLVKDPIAWGQRLIQTNDHDPLYVGLANWNVKGSRLRRYLLAYWCCYSVGASYHLSEAVGSRFWDQLKVAAENVQPSPLGDRWPRAPERRHWRGQKCVDSVEWLRGRYKHPEEAVIDIEHHAITLQDVEAMVGQWPQFGPWIAFKAADMVERVLGQPIRFPETLISMYKDPQEGAHLAAEVYSKGNMGPWSPEALVMEMLDTYGVIPAPGKPGRMCNIQEVETVLCKWKSAHKGGYFIGKDTAHHRAELERWGAHDLLAAYPTVAA